MRSFKEILLEKVNVGDVYYSDDDQRLIIELSGINDTTPGGNVLVKKSGKLSGQIAWSGTKAHLAIDVPIKK